MSLFQHVAVWTLRALALWAALEVGAALFNQGLERGDMLLRLRAHEGAMIRLNERAAEQETQAQAAEAQLAAAASKAWRIAAPRADAPLADLAAAALRENLLALGAQAPNASATEASLAGPLRRIDLVVSWRENADAAPAVLHALAGQNGHLEIASMRLERDDALVDIELEARALAIAEVRP